MYNNKIVFVYSFRAYLFVFILVQWNRTNKQTNKQTNEQKSNKIDKNSEINFLSYLTHLHFL